MIAKTPAILYSVNAFHSTKQNKDYKTLGLVIDGRAKSHFLSEKNAEEILLLPAVRQCMEAGEPINVIVTFNVYCTEKGWGANITDIQ